MAYRIAVTEPAGAVVNLPSNFTII